MSDPAPRLTAALADRYRVERELGLADRYRIERELGQGGMATVYLAEDVKRIPKRDSVRAERAAIMRGN